MDRHRNNNRRDNYYRDFYNEKDVEDRLKKNELIKGTLIIEGYNKCFVKNGNEKINIETDKDRNRAFNGDIVVIEKDPKNKNRGIKIYIYNLYYFIYFITI